MPEIEQRNEDETDLIHPDFRIENLHLWQNRGWDREAMGGRPDDDGIRNEGGLCAGETWSHRYHFV